MHRNEASKAVPLDDAELRTLESEHRLTELMKLMDKHLKPYIKPSWQKLIEQILAMEGEHSDWSRYQWGRSRPAKGKRDAQPAEKYERPWSIPVKELVEGMEAMISDVFLSDPGAPVEEWSVLYELGMIGSDISQQLYSEGLLDID
jgi:hypothetical protein